VDPDGQFVGGGIELKLIIMPPDVELAISDGALQAPIAQKEKFQSAMAVVTALGTPPVTTPTFANGAQVA
jgi:hypothetical protein